MRHPVRCCDWSINVVKPNTMATNSANETNGNGTATSNIVREEKEHSTFAGTAYYISPDFFQRTYMHIVYYKPKIGISNNYQIYVMPTTIPQCMFNLSIQTTSDSMTLIANWCICTIPLTTYKRNRNIDPYRWNKFPQQPRQRWHMHHPLPNFHTVVACSMKDEVGVRHPFPYGIVWHVIIGWWNSKSLNGVWSHYSRPCWPRWNYKPRYTHRINISRRMTIWNLWRSTMTRRCMHLWWATTHFPQAVAVVSMHMCIIPSSARTQAVATKGRHWFASHVRIMSPYLCRNYPACRWAYRCRPHLLLLCASLILLLDHRLETMKKLPKWQWIRRDLPIMLVD